MTIEKTLSGTEAVIALTGRLDTTTAPELEQELRALPEEIRKLTLDLTGLEYISSAGLRILLSSHKKMSGRDGLVLRGVGETVREVLDLTGFLEVLTLE